MNRPFRQPLKADPVPAGKDWSGCVAVAALVATVAAMAFLRPPTPEQPLIQSTLLPPDGWDFAPASPFAVSPDGSQIAFVAVARPENEDSAAGSNSIWIRDLALPEARQLAGGDGGEYPFWSPDGRWLGFFAHGKLNKIEARGGPVVPLCDATDGRGGSWNDDRHDHLPERLGRGADEGSRRRRHAGAADDPEQGPLRCRAPVAAFPAGWSTFPVLPCQHHEPEHE